MSNYRIEERDLLESEYARVVQGFEAHALEHGNPPEVSERHGFVAIEGERVVGCVSGLLYRRDGRCSRWAHLTDLFVEPPFRRKGIGRDLLRRFEAKVASLGVKQVYTWTAGYEAPGFYKKQGYTTFTELEGYYDSGHGRIGMRKALS